MTIAFSIHQLNFYLFTFYPTRYYQSAIFRIQTFITPTSESMGPSGFFLIHFIIYSWFVTRKETKRSEKRNNQKKKRWSCWNKQKCYRMIFGLIANEYYQSNIFICVCSCVGALRYFCSVYLFFSSSGWISNIIVSFVILDSKNILFRKSLSKYTHYLFPMPYGVCSCIFFFVSSLQMKISKESGDDVN